MTDTALRKSISQAADIFKNSARGIIITDTDLKLKWSNDIELSKGVLTDDCTGTAVKLINKTIPLQKTEITIEGEKFFLFSRYEDKDLMTFLKSEAADGLYCTYSSKLRIRSAEYLNIPKLITDPQQAKAVSDEIKRTNTRLLGSYINSTELIKFINADPYKEPCCLTRFLEPFLDNVIYISRANGFDFSYNVEKELFLRTDIKTLKCVLANLIVNSFMYNKNDNKKGELKIYRQNGSIYISMTDNAGGIDMQKLSLTEKPYACKNSGEGLGLYLARLYTEYSGGEITFTNKDGGLNVLIELPPKLEYIPDELWQPPYVPYPVLLDAEYLILAKGMNTVEGGRFSD